MKNWQGWVLAGIVIGAAAGAFAAPLPSAAPDAKQEAERLDKLPAVPPAPATGHTDQTGRKEKGKASFYSSRFNHRKMANGKRLNPDAHVAASKTLPLGSVASVTNLENGKSTTVRIEDRGPYVNGRIVDLTPKAADELDMNHKGVVPVEVKPITLPKPDGTVVLGAGAADASPQQVQQAVQATQEATSGKTAESMNK